MLLLLICNFSSGKCVYLCLPQKKIYLDLYAFNANLFVDKVCYFTPLAKTNIIDLKMLKIYHWCYF